MCNDALCVEDERYTGRRRRAIVAKGSFEDDRRFARGEIERVKPREESGPVRVSSGGQSKREAGENAPNGNCRGRGRTVIALEEANRCDERDRRRSPGAQRNPAIAVVGEQ
jgi:hypothetical protein